jgi:GT2 family glycosyltransferase
MKIRLFKSFTRLIMPKENKLVTVLVLNWNGKRFLQKCIGSLLNQDYLMYEVLLIDNASTDGSIEYVRNLFGVQNKLRIISLNKNYGFSKGNNIGIQSCSKSAYVVILNNDTEAKENFISELVNVAESDEQVGSVGCKILSPDQTVWFSQKFTNGGFIVPFLLQTLVGKRIDEISDKISVNLSNSGCAILFRKSVLDKIGGYDEDFWSNWEDWDLGYRLNEAGFKSVYIPKPLVLHVGGGSEGFSPERCVKIYRNMLFTYFKNYEDVNLLIRFPILLFVFLPIFHFGWLINRLLWNQPDFYKGKELQYFLSMEKAIFEFLTNLRIFARKRYVLKSLRKTSDSKIFSNTSLKGIM